MDYNYKYRKYYHKYWHLKNKYQKAGQNKSLNAITQRSMSDASIFFTLNLFDSLDGASNLISPLSISFALGMIQLATIGNTDKELTNLFNHKYNLDELQYIYRHFNNEIVKMNNVFIINQNKPINKEYLQMIEPMTMVVHKNFDDAPLIAEKINQYVEQNTDGMIKNIITPKNINPRMFFVLVNTIYFKGSWKNKFDVRNTTKMKFHKTDDDMVDMMHQVNYFNYYENEMVQLVELPYDEKNYAMGIVLPKKYLEEDEMGFSVNNVPQLTPFELNEMINNIQYTRVDLYLPKFTQRKNIDLVPILEKLGVTTLFHPKDAGLDLISKDIYLSYIIHESIIIVDELGTEAVATTVIGAKSTAVLEKETPKLFKANHAFVFYIRDVSNNLFLFYGDYQGSNSLKVI